MIELESEVEKCHLEQLWCLTEEQVYEHWPLQQVDFEYKPYPLQYLIAQTILMNSPEKGTKRKE
jgi:hypothetical protein